MPSGKFIDYSIGWATIEKEIISEEKLKQEIERDKKKKLKPNVRLTKIVSGLAEIHREIVK